jgi:ketosteroid isomerase-like protein
LGALPWAMLLVTAALAQGSGTQTRTRQFLDAYVKGDAGAVMAVVDGGTVAYGSDAAEVFRGRDGVAKMLKEDGQLWRGSAVIGEMKDVSVVEKGELATIFFNAPFQVGGRPAIPVRFSMVWRRKGGHWLLLQSQSAALTEGQSAAALLAGSR